MESKTEKHGADLQKGHGLPTTTPQQWSPTSTCKGITRTEARLFDLARLPRESQIQNIAEAEYFKAAESVIRFIKADLGIRHRDINGAASKNQYRYETTSVAKFWRDHFGFLTFADIKQAFTLQILGKGATEIDRATGEAKPLGHYQSFDLTYQSAVLRAYLRTRNQAEQKARKTLPQPVATVTEQEAAERVAAYFRDVQNRYPEVPKHWELAAPEFAEILADKGWWRPTFSQRRKAYRAARQRMQAKRVAQRNADRYAAEHISRAIRQIMNAVTVPAAHRDELRAAYKISLAAVVLRESWDVGVKFEI